MAREKRRNSEKRKEKSRDAARSRRSKETEIFTELADCLPLSENVSHQLDKASVMRLAISQLKIGDVLDAVGIADNSDKDNDSLQDDHDMLVKQMRNEKMLKDLWITSRKDTMECALPDGQSSHLYLKALEGTVIILSSDGDFVYLSENVAKYLGLQQIEMMGQSIYDYIHPCDHEEIRNALSMKSGNTSPEQKHSSTLVRTFSIRMRCTLTTKGRSVNLKSAPYKVMKCSGRLISGGDKSEGSCDEEEAAPSTSFKPYLLAMVEPIPHPSNIEVPLDSSTFLSKHEMDMSFVFCDDRIEDLAGYDPTAVVGQSFFDFHHALDSENIKKTFKDLYSKGQAMTPAYRMLAANGGYVWIITQATTINNSRNQKPQSIVCVHYVLSGVEEKDALLSNIQIDLAMPTGACPAASPIMTATKLEVLSPMPTPPAPLTPSTQGSLTPTRPSDNLLTVDDLLEQQQPLQLDLLPPKLELSTESIFAPKTKYMEKALCRPPELAPYPADDPDDLSCLSPMAGDEVMTLPFTNNNTEDFLSSPMLSMAKSPSQMVRQTELLSPGQYSGETPSSDCSRATSPADYFNCVMPLEMDPIEKFFAPLEYNNLSCDDSVVNFNTNNSNNNSYKKNASVQHSPLANNVCVVPTKQELVDELGEEDIVDIDFAMRAPYIPMDSDQDFDLIPPSNAALFDLSKDDINPSVFGRTEYVFGPKETLYEEPKPMPKRSLKDMLGESTVVASIEQPPETKYLQMKRPLDMNCLEKGPPTTKLARLEQSVSTALSAPVQPCRGVNAAGNKNSVLLNLLLTGEDISYGYKVSQKPIVSTNTARTNVRETNRFDTLTRQDCEVNAPIQCGKLLQGVELFNDLDL